LLEVFHHPGCPGLPVGQLAQLHPCVLLRLPLSVRVEGLGQPLGQLAAGEQRVCRLLVTGVRGAPLDALLGRVVLAGGGLALSPRGPATPRLPLFALRVHPRRPSPSFPLSIPSGPGPPRGRRAPAGPERSLWRVLLPAPVLPGPARPRRAPDRRAPRAPWGGSSPACPRAPPAEPTPGRHHLRAREPHAPRTSDGGG